MPKITLDLTEEAIEIYTRARGKGNNEMTDAEFVEACLLAEITETVTQKLTEEKQEEAVQDVVVPDISN